MQRVRWRQKRRRVGLTLIELLVTISIMATVASMFVVAYRSAATEANNIRTASTIRKIHEVLMARLQEYESTPVTFTSPIPGSAFTFTAESPAILIERARLLALREIICTEMPDHPSDLALLPVTQSRPTGLVFTNPMGANINIFVQIPASARALNLKQRLQSGSWSSEHENAELLYLVIEDSSFNGSSAIELFGKSEIADTDSDGFNEFVDSYRRPIQWIRWPTGFPGITRFIPDPWDSTLALNLNGEPEGEPFDTLKADPGYRVGAPPELRPGIATFPLVASSGVDSRFGMRFTLEGVTSNLTAMNSLSAKDVTFPVPYGPLIMPDPWFPRDREQTFRLGGIVDPVAFQDDITNYSAIGASL